MKSLIGSLRAIFAATALACGMAVLSGCEEGPLEETGEEIDDAIDEAEDELN